MQKAKSDKGGEDKYGRKKRIKRNVKTKEERKMIWRYVERRSEWRETASSGGDRTVRVSDLIPVHNVWEVSSGTRSSSHQRSQSFPFACVKRIDHICKQKN